MRSSSKRLVARVARGLRTLLITLLLLFFSANWVVLADISVPQTDQTASAPLPSPNPSVAHPRYLSGFGVDNAFTIFYEDRNDTSGCPGGTYRIYFNQTTTGPFGFSASSTKTNLCDSHFVVKKMPISIGGTTYDYRGWGAGNYSGVHTFYATNDLVNWTTISTFTFPNPFGDQILYGFHDIIELNGHYMGFAESAGGHTYIVWSAAGDQTWSVVNRVGGVSATDRLYLNASSGPKPSGNFVLMQVDGKMVLGKLMTPGDSSGAFLAINREVEQASSPAQAEAAFQDPNDWTWRNGSAGAPIASDEVLVQTSQHNVNGTWILPMSDPLSDLSILYTADYTSGPAAFGIGCAAHSAECLVEVPASPPSSSNRMQIPTTGFPPGRISRVDPMQAGQTFAPPVLQLEIPALGVTVPVVGVPQVNDQWDVSWLGDEAGYLEGTAFPTLPGNSAIAGHVYDAYGRPGPFVRLSSLSYGDAVILRAWGFTYLYQVRTNRLVNPDDQSVFRHEPYAWVTLLTCQGYDPTSGAYRYRRAVGAVLVSIR